MHQVFRSAGLTTPTLAAGYLAALMPLVAIEYFFPISKARKLTRWPGPGISASRGSGVPSRARHWVSSPSE